MRLNTMKPAPGAKRKRLRVGRGASAGQGKTCGKGGKGQKARKAKLNLKAKAPKGTKPRKDSDKFDFVCEPALEGCGGSPSGAFIDD